MARPFVLLVSIDGFAAFYWRDERVKAPTLRALAERGAVADGVTAVFPSTTWPTHVSLVTGVRPARHGVVANHIINRATRPAEEPTVDPICADSHQHLFGPRAPEVYWAIEYIDACIGRLLAALPAAVRERAAVFVVSDHGFLPVERDIRPNVRLRRLGAMRGDGVAGFSGEACFVMNHGAGYLYALDCEAGAVRSRAGEIAKMDGVAATWPRERFAELGLPADHRMLPDAVFEAKPGYQFSDEAAGEDENGAPKYRGTHGQRPEAPGNAAFFLASGAGIRRSAKLGRIQSRDVAPTLAAVLDIAMPDVEGRVLSEILDA